MNEEEKIRCIFRILSERTVQRSYVVITTAIPTCSILSH